MVQNAPVGHCYAQNSVLSVNPALMPEYDPVFVLLTYGQLYCSIAKQCI